MKTPTPNSPTVNTQAPDPLSSERSTITVNRHDLAMAFTEWDRRYREDPERFQSEAARLLKETPETYGDRAAPYLLHIVQEQRPPKFGPVEIGETAEFISGAVAHRGTVVSIVPPENLVFVAVVGYQHLFVKALGDCRPIR